MSFRGDFLGDIEQLVNEKVPYPSRNAVVAMLLTLGLQEWEKRQEEPPTNLIPAPV
jgi:hypothetical protein